MIITEIQYFFSKIIRFQAIFKDTVEFTCALEFKISSQLFHISINKKSTTLPVSSPLLLRNPPNTFAFIPLPTMSLSSLNRSNSNAFRHIMSYSAPICEGMHYHKTGVPRQIKSIFIIYINLPRCRNFPLFLGFL